MVDFSDIVTELDTAENPEDFHNVCSRFADQYGFDNFIYGARIPVSMVKPYFVFLSSYPVEWTERYDKKGYIQIDPVIGHCATHETPIKWRGLEHSHVLKEATDFGLNDGFSTSMNSSAGDFSVMSFATSSTNMADKEMTIALPLGMFFLTYLHEHIKNTLILPSTLNSSMTTLTEREREALLWLSEGKSDWDISNIMDISERTVKFHLRNIFTKLGVYNRQHAVSKALASGLIAPDLTKLKLTPHLK